MAKVLLVQPWNYRDVGVRQQDLGSQWRNGPYGIILLATILRKHGHDARVIDLGLELVEKDGDVGACLAGFENEIGAFHFRDKQVKLQLFVLAYNMGNFLRRLVLPRSIKRWTLTTMREKLIKIGTKMVTTARYICFQMAEVAVPKKLFASILDSINGLRPLTAT